MRGPDPILRPLALLALLTLAGCGSDTVELVREIDDAREGCTEEKLKAGAEECVRMMERYAEMGTEAMRGYIGAVKSLDRALRRMPPPRLDTAGLGHALSLPAGSISGWGDTSAAAWERPKSERSPWAGGGVPAYSGAHGADPRDPRDPYGAEADSYRQDPPYGGPSYEEPYPGGLYPGWESLDPRGPYGAQQDAWGPGPGFLGRLHPGAYDSPEEPWRTPGGWEGDPRGPAEGRRGESGRPGREGRAGRDADPRSAAPARGRLLPPEERLRRPWLDDEERDRPREPATRRPYRALRPDTAGSR